MQAARKGKGKQHAPANKRGKNKGKRNTNVTDVYEASDDERQLTRKGHDLDDVDNYEYSVGHIAEEDDEDIDSDEAFDESDEERFESFTFKGSSKRHKEEVDDDEEEEDEEEQDREIDLNEDSDEQPEESEDEEEQGSDEEDSDEKEEEEDEALEKKRADIDEIMDLLGSDDEAEDEDLRLDSDEEDNDIGAIVGKAKREREDAASGDEDDKRSAKRQRQKEQTEANPENEYNLSARSSGDKKNQIDLNDLMGSMGNEAAFSSLRKSILELDGKGKNTVEAPLQAPLAKRLQDREDRQLAYEEAKEEISKWQDTVRELRQAEHLSFPMQASATEHRITNAALASKFKPETSMEKQIEQVLQASGMTDKHLADLEKMELSKLTPEEAEERTRLLRWRRELMYRHEVKAKRQKKIKSKSYRKLERKEKIKREAKLAGLQDINDLDDLDGVRERGSSDEEEELGGPQRVIAVINNKKKDEKPYTQSVVTLDIGKQQEDTQYTRPAVNITSTIAEDSDDEKEEPAMVHSTSKVAFTQRDLVARAFANDNVVLEFEEEKRAIVEEDDDKEEDLTLPGWGSWGGSGIKKTPKKKKTKIIKGIRPEERKDAKLAHVIINEKRNKKIEKYEATTVPFPFQNMEQYERYLRTPVGKEWNTQSTFQKLTKPRVMTKLGTVIDPLNVPFKTD